MRLDNAWGTSQRRGNVVTLILPSLTLAGLTDAAAMARATDSATTIAVVATRQTLTVLPSGRITIVETTR